MKQLGLLLSAITWLLVAGSVVVITGGLFGRPLLLAAVPTGSMAPVLQPGDLIVLLPTWAVPAAGLGDIVVYTTGREPKWVVHRIIDGNAAEGFIIKGDANHSADPGRVFPREIAGVVPQVGRSALRLPRLGLLSTGTGPLSSPIVPGLALVVGVYLLVADSRPGLRLPWLPHRQDRRGRSHAVLSLYAGLAGTVFVSTLIPAWTLSSSDPIQYEVVMQRPANVKKAGQYIRGQPHQEAVEVKNPSPLPLIVVFNSPDAAVDYQPGWALIPPRQAQVFTASVSTEQVGVHNGQVDMGVFLPLLPPPLLAWLLHRHMAFAVLVTASVPAVFILGIAALDPRTRQAVNRIRYRLAARFLS